MTSRTLPETAAAFSDGYAFPFDCIVASFQERKPLHSLDEFYNPQLASSPWLSHDMSMQTTLSQSRKIIQSTGIPGKGEVERYESC